MKLLLAAVQSGAKFSQLLLNGILLGTIMHLQQKMRNRGVPLFRFADGPKSGIAILHRLKLCLCHIDKRETEIQIRI